MTNLEKVKKELIEHIYNINKEKLNIFDLRTYAEIVKIMDDIERSNKPNEWIELMNKFQNYGIGGSYKKVEMKEG